MQQVYNYIVTPVIESLYTEYMKNTKVRHFIQHSAFSLPQFLRFYHFIVIQTFYIYYLHVAGPAVQSSLLLQHWFWSLPGLGNNKFNAENISPHLKQMLRTQSFLSDEVTGKESAASALWVSAHQKPNLLNVCGRSTRMDSAAREVLAPRVYAKKPWITQVTLPIIDQRWQCRKAWKQRDNLEEHQMIRDWQRLREDHWGKMSSRGQNKLHLLERLIYWVIKSRMHLARSANWHNRDRSTRPRQHH